MKKRRAIARRGSDGRAALTQFHIQDAVVLGVVDRAIDHMHARRLDAVLQQRQQTFGAFHAVAIGTVGFGVDALGMLGIKLDSSPDRTDTGLLPTHDDGKAADEYSKLGLTGKVKVSQTELKIGTLIPSCRPCNRTTAGSCRKPSKAVR